MNTGNGKSMPKLEPLKIAEIPAACKARGKYGI